MDFITRFKNRKVISPTLEVPVVLDDGKITFTVSRIGQGEIIESRLKAEKLAKLAGDTFPAEGSKSLHYVALALSEHVKRHITGFVHEPAQGEKLEYSAMIVDELFESMDETYRAYLGYGYLIAAEEDQKKISDTSPPTSSNSSDGASSTT